MFQRAQANFETLWQDGEFQSYDPNNEGHQKALASALHRESGRGVIATSTFFDIQPKPFQQDILEQLQNERSFGRMRNLLVAATGTGKTVMAAFNYLNTSKSERGLPRLLFLAHRKEILVQSLRTFRQVLRDQNFGDVLDGHSTPSQYEHLFATLQSVSSRDLVDQYGPEYWQVVVIDECHHIDEIDYRDVPWRQSGEAAALSNLLENNTERARAIMRAWNQLVDAPQNCKTLVFA